MAGAVCCAPAEIKVWSSQYDAAKTHDIPSMAKLMEWLPQYCPKTDDAQSVVHGDFRCACMGILSRRTVSFVPSWPICVLVAF